MELAGGYRFKKIKEYIFKVFVIIIIILINLRFNTSKEIVQFNSNSAALPDVGDFESVLDFHPQYVHLE